MANTDPHPASSRSRRRGWSTALVIYAIFVLFSVLLEYLRLHTVPVPAWVQIADEWLPLTGFLAAITVCVFVGRRYFARAERIVLVMVSVPFVVWITTPLLQSPRPQPAYYRVQISGTYLAFHAHAYAESHDGQYPPHLAALLLGPQYTHPSWFTDNLPPFPDPRPPMSDWPKFAPLVDEHAIFLYTAADLVDPALPQHKIAGSLDPALIIAYTKPLPRIPGHRVVVFSNNDSHLVAEADLPKTFATSNAARTKLGLPPVPLDGPPPSPTPK